MALAMYEIESRRAPLTVLQRKFPHLGEDVRRSKDDVIRVGAGPALVGERLAQIIRFGNGQETEKRMECPTNVLDHSVRVEALAVQLVTICKEVPQFPPVDPVRVADLAITHDIEEARVGDVTKNVKDAMTPHERAQHAERVRRELLDMGRKEYGLKIGTPEWIRFVQRIEETMAKRTIEAQVVKIADLLDAVGEIVHELRCGNRRFAEILEEYNGALSEAQYKYPVWNAIKTHPLVQLAIPLRPEHILAQPHLSPLDFGNIGERKERTRRFRRKVLEGDLPPFYQTWLKTTLVTFGKDAPQVLFPRWNLAPLE